MAADFLYIPPSSQASENSPKIFTYPSGSPIEIFVDAGGIAGSPKLIRTIRNAGAKIVHFPGNAQIILVDQTVNSGRQFIRDWRDDSDKAVLQHAWVRHCIDTGRALLGDDEWGRMMAVDDGKPLEADGTTDAIYTTANIESSPLPTPRPTPTDAAPPPSSRSPSHRHERSQDPLENGIDPALEISVAAQSALSLHCESIPQQNVEGYPTLTSELASLGSPTPHDPFTEFNKPEPASFSSTQTQIPLEHPFSPSISMQSYQQQQQFSQSGHPLPIFSPGFQQGFPMGMTPGDALSMSMGIPMGHTNTNATQLPPTIVSAIMDVMRLGQQVSMPGAMQPQNGVCPPAQFNGVQTTHANPVFGTAVDPPSSVDSSSFSSPSGRTPPLASTSTRPSRSQVSPNSGVVGSSSRRHRHAESKTSKKMRKKKNLASRDVVVVDEPAHDSYASPRGTKSRKKRSRSSSGSETDAKSVTPVEPAHPSLPSSPRKSGGIFWSKGRPLVFFVQVDLRNRFQVVQKIKKNGGQLCGDHLQADYAILYSRSGAFKDLLASLRTKGRPAITPAFVDDCIEAGALLEVDESEGHVIGLETRGEKRPTSISFMPEKRGRPRKKVADTKEKEPKESVKESVLESVLEKRPKKMKKMARSLGDEMDRPRSPTPPAANEQMRASDGKWYFSAEERNWLLAYCAVLVERDITISNSAISTMAHTKLPHHPAASWYYCIRAKCKDDIERIRKRAGIALRKRNDAAVASQEKKQQVRKTQDVNERPSSSRLDSVTDAEEAQTLPPVGGQDDPPSLPVGQIQTQGEPPFSTHVFQSQNHDPLVTQALGKDEQEDFDVICEFFANGGGNDSDDEQVWLNLTNHKRCKTNSDWSEFYRERESQINEQIKSLLRAAGGYIAEEDEGEVKAS